MRDAHLALGHAAGRKVEHKGLLGLVAHTHRYANAAGVGAKASIATLPRGDHGARHDVHKMQRHVTAGHRHFSEMTNAPQVVRVRERHDAGAVLCHTLKGEVHGLLAHGLAKALLAIQPQQHAAVHAHLNAAVGLEVFLQNRVDVARCHAHAVRVVAAQIGHHQVAGDLVGLGGIAACGLKQLGDVALQFGG